MKAICRFNAIPIKIPVAFLSVLEQIILKFLWTLKRPQIAKTILGKNKAGYTTLPDFMLYYKATVIKAVWYWDKNRNISGTGESPETNPGLYGQSMSKEAGIYNEEMTASSKKRCWGKLDRSCKKKKSDHFLIPYTKMN